MLARADQVESGSARRLDLLHTFLYLPGHRFAGQVLGIDEDSQFHGRSFFNSDWDSACSPIIVSLD